MSLCIAVEYDCAIRYLPVVQYSFLVENTSPGPIVLLYVTVNTDGLHTDDNVTTFLLTEDFVSSGSCSELASI